MTEYERHCEEQLKNFQDVKEKKETALRDEFAKIVFTDAISDFKDSVNTDNQVLGSYLERLDRFTRACYQIADAMMEARKKAG